MRRHGKVDSHGHGIVGRMTSTENIGWLGNRRRKKRQTEAECSKDEKKHGDGDEEWSRSSCESVSPAFDTFKTGKDKARAGTGHDARDWGCFQRTVTASTLGVSAGSIRLRSRTDTCIDQSSITTSVHWHKVDPSPSRYTQFRRNTYYSSTYLVDPSR
jgi:hypothetical protein